MANYIYKEYDTYLVRMRIPKDLKDHFGKSTFCRSLKTSSKREATRLAAPLIANWKDMIDKARGDDNSMKGLVIESLRKEWEHATDEQRELVEMYTIENHSPSEYKTVIGNLRPLRPLIDAYMKSKEDEQLTPTSLQMIQGRLNKLSDRFENVQEITIETLREWAGSLDVSPATKAKYVVNTIAMLDFHAIDTTDLSKITFKTTRKAAAKAEKRRACSPEEFKDVLGVALDDLQRDFMLVSAYTGMRLEEVARLKNENVNLSKGYVEVVDGKTLASNRAIPISNKIAGILRNRKKGEYVFDELTTHEGTGNRGSLMSGRFTKARRKVGLPDTVVFHSLRKMFITKLHEERVAVDIMKKIVGHSDQDITTGLYSDASLWAEMVEAVNKVEY